MNLLLNQEDLFFDTKMKVMATKKATKTKFDEFKTLQLEKRKAALETKLKD